MAMTGPLTVRAKIIINDVTNINPIEVSQVLAPTTNAEIKLAVKSHSGPISIGGGRFSMGGQTATENALQIDMRAFNKSSSSMSQLKNHSSGGHPLARYLGQS